MYLFLNGCMYACKGVCMYIFTNGCKGVCLQGNQVCMYVTLNCVFIRCWNITYLGFFVPDQILKSTELF